MQEILTGIDQQELDAIFPDWVDRVQEVSE
jgi:hypothetical protein